MMGSFPFHTASAKQRCWFSSETPETVLAPVIRTGARLIVAEVVPGITGVAVVLAHGAPLALAEIRAPALPPGRAGAVLGQAVSLRALDCTRWVSSVHCARCLLHGQR